ncbi:GNAT family N-acetyltransferase [Candidatus Peregrinibacteria bacterium]|nr:GNAT family N-acetyltransferase [Candidatus Peregrinibacteria bacterium]
MVKIEEFNQQDISSLLKWLEGTNARFLYQFAGPKYHFPLTEQQLLQTIESKEVMPFKVIDIENGKNIGHCQFMRISKENSSASIGRLLVNPDQRGKGFGTMMLKAMINYAENTLKLKKLKLRVFDFNRSAIKCYKKLDFTEIKIETVKIDDLAEKWDCISMEYII